MAFTLVSVVSVVCGATRADIREAVTTLKASERIGRRVLGGNHPVTLNVEKCLRAARAALRASDDFSDDACDYDEPD